MSFKKGDTVRVVAPTIEGTILTANFDADLRPKYLVEYQSEAGLQRVFFDADKLVKVDQPTEATPAA